jgi:hypothetical protein
VLLAQIIGVFFAFGQITRDLVLRWLLASAVHPIVLVPSPNRGPSRYIGFHGLRDI